MRLFAFSVTQRFGCQVPQNAWVSLPERATTSQ